MNIIWLGHGGFRIETRGQVLLIDPWLTGNPVQLSHTGNPVPPEDQHEAAVAGATHILLTHTHFTMDMKGAAYAARRYFNFKTIIPCHYQTFPILEDSADALKTGLSRVDVIEPQVMKAMVF